MMKFYPLNLLFVLALVSTSAFGSLMEEVDKSDQKGGAITIKSEVNLALIEVYTSIEPKDTLEPRLTLSVTGNTVTVSPHRKIGATEYPKSVTIFAEDKESLEKQLKEKGFLSPKSESNNNSNEEQKPFQAKIFARKGNPLAEEVLKTSQKDHPKDEFTLITDLKEINISRIQQKDESGETVLDCSSKFIFNNELEARGFISSWVQAVRDGIWKLNSSEGCSKFKLIGNLRLIGSADKEIGDRVKDYMNSRMSKAHKKLNKQAAEAS